MAKWTKVFFFLLALAVMLFIAFGKSAYAEDLTLSWTLPDGSEQCVASTEVPVIIETQIWMLVGTAGPAEEQTTITGLLPGDYVFSATVINDQGMSSRHTGPVTKTVGPLTVVDDKAYTVVKSGGGFVAFIIGTVPVGTECDAENMVKGKFNFLPFTGYAVPMSSVTVTGNVEPSAVVAVCQ